MTSPLPLAEANRPITKLDASDFLAIAWPDNVRLRILRLLSTPSEVSNLAALSATSEPVKQPDGSVKAEWKAHVWPVIPDRWPKNTDCVVLLEKPPPRTKQQLVASRKRGKRTGQPGATLTQQALAMVATGAVTGYQAALITGLDPSGVYRALKTARNTPVCPTCQRAMRHAPVVPMVLSVP